MSDELIVVGPKESTRADPPAAPVAAELLAAATQAAGGNEPRRRLPNRRWHFIQRFCWREPGKADVFYELTVGFFEDGTVGELFMDGALDQQKVWLKVGSKMETILDLYAELASRLLQFGMRLRDLARCGPPDDIWRGMIEVAIQVETGVGPRLAREALNGMRPLVRELPGVLRRGDPAAAVAEQLV